MKASSSCNFPRACKSSTSTCKMSSTLPSRTHCWNRRWQVWYGGYFLGNSRYWTPVPKPTRFRYALRVGPAKGAPRPLERRFGRKIGSITSHWASLSPHHPRVPSFCPFSLTQKIAK